MKEKLLITGGSGLLALNWAITIRDQYDVILGLHERQINLSGVHTKKLNLDSVDALKKVLDEIQPSLTIHTVGLTNVDECEVKPELAQYINSELAGNIALACRAQKVPLVHISTDHLFSGETPYVHEDAPVSPLNTYARTKAEAEERVLEINPDSLVVRTNFYGWGTRYRYSFSDFIINSIRSKKEITLFSDVFYTPIITESLVTTVHDLVASKASGIFNVVGDERISKYKFGLKLSDKFNLDKKLILMGEIPKQKTQTKRPGDMSLSNIKAATFLGRKLGSIDKHIDRLCFLECDGMANELSVV